MRASNLGEALKEAGFDQFELQAKTIAANFIKAGGTREKWLSYFDAAERMPGMGQTSDAAIGGHSVAAQTRQQVEGEEASHGVPKGPQPIAASPSFDRGGDGQAKYAQSRQMIVAVPVREPSVAVKPNAPRGITVIVSAIQPVKQGFLMLQKKTSDGRLWGNVRWYELDGMRRDGAIAHLVKNRIARPSNPNSKLDEILTDAQFAEIYNASQKQIATV